MEATAPLDAGPRPLATVAVVSWNTRDLLATCLESLRPEVDAGRADVWVVDNDSTDGSAELVEEAFSWAHLVRSGGNLGFGRAVNLVARSTSTSWIAPANADVELAPGALAELIAAGDADRATGCVAPRLILPDGSTQASVQRFPSAWLALGRRLRLHRLSGRIGARLSLSDYWDPDRPAVVDWATGAFLLVRRSAWDAVGGFDESQWMYAEDLDLCWRLGRRGWRTRYVPRAVARHHHAAAAVQAFGDDSGRRRREVQATYRWIARRRGVPHAWTTALVNLAGSAAALAVLSLLARARRDRYAERLAAARRGIDRASLGLRSRHDLLRPEP